MHLSDADRSQLSKLHHFLRTSFAGSSIAGSKVDEMAAALGRALSAPKCHLQVADWLEKRDATYSAAIIRRYYEIST